MFPEKEGKKTIQRVRTYTPSLVTQPKTSILYDKEAQSLTEHCQTMITMIVYNMLVIIGNPVCVVGGEGGGSQGYAARSPGLHSLSRHN